jgi:hypothetical protein
MTRALIRRVAKLETAQEKVTMARVRSMSDEELKARMDSIAMQLPIETVRALFPDWPSGHQCGDEQSQPD